METAEFTTSTGTIRIAVRVIADIANKAVLAVPGAVSYTHLTLPTKLEV